MLIKHHDLPPPPVMPITTGRSPYSRASSSRTVLVGMQAIAACTACTGAAARNRARMRARGIYRATGFMLASGQRGQTNHQTELQRQRVSEH